MGDSDPQWWFQTQCELLQSDQCTCLYLSRHGLVVDDEKMRSFKTVASRNTSLTVLMKLEVRHLTEVGLRLLAEWLNNRGDTRLAMLVLDFSDVTENLPFFVQHLHSINVKFLSFKLDYGFCCETDEEAASLSAFFERNYSVYTLELICTDPSPNTISRDSNRSFLLNWMRGLSNNTSLNEIIFEVTDSQESEWIQTLSSIEAPNVKKVRLTGSVPSPQFSTFLTPWRTIQQCSLHNVSLDETKLRALAYWLRGNTDLRGLELSSFTKATFDDLLSKLIPVVENHPSLKDIAIHFKGENEHFGVLDSNRAASIGKCMESNTQLRSFALRVGGCTDEGASVFAEFVAKVNLEKLILFGPISVDQANCIVDGIQYNLSLLDVRDLGTDEDWEETMNRVQVNNRLSEITERNKRIKEHLTPILTDSTISDSLLPHVIERLSERRWYDILYMACRERVLIG